jgi:hypothetical protein
MANPDQDQAFSGFIEGLSRGSLNDEATDQLRELVKEMTRIAETSGGKPKGKLVLTINLMLDRGIMDVDPKLTVTRPTPVRARSVMYALADGRLSKNDVRQNELALSSGGVKDGTPDVKDIRTARS